jgi:hypothetical protein
MAQISRQSDAEIENGNVIDADDLDAEFDTLYTAYNANDTVLTNVTTGAYTFSGVKTFSSTPLMNAIGERTEGAGITIDSVLLKDGMVTVAGTAATAGQIGYSSNQLKYHNGTSEKTIATTDGIVTMPTGYRYGKHPAWASVETVTVFEGYTCRDSTDTEIITVAGDLTVDLSDSGALGLETGSEANDTWYYLWLCKGTSGVTAVFSPSPTALTTIPSGYDDYVRRIPGGWYNDSSGDLMQGFYYGDNNSPEFLFKVSHTRVGTNDATQILNNASGNPTSWGVGGVLSIPFLPADARLVELYGLVYTGGQQSLFVRTNGDTIDGYEVKGASNPDTAQSPIKLQLTGDHEIQYYTTAAGTQGVLNVIGFRVTEAS